MNTQFKLKNLTFFPIEAQETHFGTSYVGRSGVVPGYTKELKEAKENYLNNEEIMLIHAKYAKDVISHEVNANRPLAIDGGWQQPRYSFNLEMTVTGHNNHTQTYILNGYTSDRTLSTDSVLTVNSVSVYRLLENTNPANLPGVFSHMQPLDHIHFHHVTEGEEDFHVQIPEVLYDALEMSKIGDFSNNVVDTRSAVSSRYSIPTMKALGIPSYMLSMLVNDSDNKNSRPTQHMPIRDITKTGKVKFGVLAFQLGYTSSAEMPYGIDEMQYEVPKTEFAYTHTVAAHHARTIGAAMSHFLPELAQRKLHFTLDRTEDSQSKMVFHRTDHQFSNTTENISKDLFKEFEENFIDHVMGPISHQGKIPFDLSVQADLNGMTYVGITTDFAPKRYFAYPTFADALVSPLRAVNYEQVTSLAHELQPYVDEMMSEALPGLPWTPGL